MSALILRAAGGTAAAQGIPDADSSYCVVEFGKSYPIDGNYRPGEPYDRVTISPDGTGETFDATGIAITVFLRDAQGVLLAGIPADEIFLYNSNLCICPQGSHADAPTDSNGMTTFSGTIAAGGCVESLDIYWYRFPDSVLLCTTTVKTNSADVAGTGPCFIDDEEWVILSSRYGAPGAYSICSDYNESGTIDLSDIAFFMRVLGAACQPGGAP